MNLRLAVFVLAFFSAAGWLCASEDERPVVDASKIAAEKIADAALPTFHIVGDSTVRSGGAGARSNTDVFEDYLLKDVMPLIEAKYRLAPGR